MNRFKTHKKRSNVIIYIGLFIISIAFSIKYIYQNDLIKNDTLIDILINDNLGNYNKSIKDIDFLLKYALDIDLVKEDTPVIKENDDDTLKLEQVKNENGNSEPLIYIYNTHQEEKYTSNYNEPYSITSSVLIASKILKEYLEEYDLKVLVEEDSVSDKLHSLNWKYGYSYKVSRMFLEDAFKNNPSLKYFIDLHRDSSVYEKTTTEIDGEKYARLLFVVGLDHENYEPNLQLVTKLRERIDAYNKDLCRGIMKKSGKGVNGIYNQDFSDKVMLIEVGGQYNSISEVNNTLKVLAKILADFIKEDLNA